MKIVITSMSDSLTSTFDRRFGRAAWFCILDTEDEAIRFIPNEHVNASNGAGLKAAETMGELKVTKVISGDFGPKAKQLLDKFGIQMVMMDEADILIEEIIERLNHN
ncbi:dinitrogenase iron-molybdenum cofactor biosynthesis protein [Halosquirtibacter xylanolyticus]|uniref:NifB/NifX family molybdenum-iron cluster-binding protein n=1 Tax=Halosquirtibacter xylanolyticus TaxID=3374599 RepID=UPI00374A53B0|nr:dinitrogenase iron-molybdenum cofactor biosynthesis protein [Prolixibacteraceae bacterium]